MTKVVYEVVQHDGGWAYRADGVLSETFPTHEEARMAAAIVATEHERPGESEEIEFEDSAGQWHTEHADGRDRPSTSIKDDAKG